MIKLTEKIGYGFGDMASSMFWKLFGAYLMIFYTDVFGLPAAAVGTMFLITRIWDSVFDPIVGVAADRTQTRWGKFRPYLLWLAIPFAAIGVLTFTTPSFGQTGNLIYAYITYSLMMMVYSAINVPYASLLGVMSPLPQDRNTLSTYRMVFAYIGSFIALLLFMPMVRFFSGNSDELADQQLNFMNKLINRISPETSENRILHAGFSIILMSEEITQTLSGLSSDMIIFILSGSITIYSTKEEKKTIGEQYMIFLRSFENYTYDITLGSKIIIFFFDSLTMNELPYYQHPYGILPQPISKWIELKIVEPLYGFLELVGQYLENNFLNYPLYELKRTELFYLLKKLYRKEELDYFFYLSSTHSAEFERLIAENYIKAKTVTDLAQMIGYGVNSFRMKFKKVFGIPAYEWLMQEKSKRLLVAIANSEDDFKNIIDEFDFSSHSHFYKFCKARFGYSPTELRKKLKSL